MDFRQTLKDTIWNVYEQQKAQVSENIQNQLKGEATPVLTAVMAQVDQSIKTLIAAAVPENLDNPERAALQTMDNFCQQLGDLVIPAARAEAKNQQLTINVKQLGKKIATELRNSRYALEKAVSELLIEINREEEGVIVPQTHNETRNDETLYFPEELLGQPAPSQILAGLHDLDPRQAPAYLREYIQKLGGFGNWNVKFFKDPRAQTVCTLVDARHQICGIIIPGYADRDEEYGKPDIVNGLCRAKLAAEIDPIFATYVFEPRSPEGEKITDRRVNRFIAENINLVATAVTDLWITDLRHEIDPKLTTEDLSTALTAMYLNFAFPQFDKIVKNETGITWFEPAKMMQLVANVKANVERYQLRDHQLQIPDIPFDFALERRNSNPYQLRDWLFSKAGQRVVKPINITYAELIQRIDELIKVHPGGPQDPNDMINPFRLGNIDPLANFFTQLPSLPDSRYPSLELFEEAIQAMCRGGAVPF